MNTVIKSIVRIFQKLVIKIFYNNYTIADYFRSQGANIGKNNRFHIRSLGSEPYLIHIENNCVISSGVRFITHDGAVGIFRDEVKDLNIFGTIEIKDRCFIGIGSILMPDITIGPNSVVGAGSVVTKDVPPGSVVAGVPAKVICSVDDYKQKCIQKYKALNLQGPQSTWKTQLIKHFWGSEADKT
jgi:acetyltransferase-like isoleucine patch superfamily enzyme